MWSKTGILPGLAALALTVGLSSTGNAQAVPPVGQDQGVSAWGFDMSQVTLSTGRFFDNQARTLVYLKWIDVDRLLYVFRKNHGLYTNNAQPNAGWDAPDFPFRSHVQGHFLNAWAFCYAQLQDSECKRRATYFAAELKKCQHNNTNSRNVPYYAIHKTMAGLLDVWRLIGDTNARDVLLAMAAWVDLRTGKLTYQQMQDMMGTVFGGMNEVLADLCRQTGDQRWVTVAQRFDHAAIFNPLASNQDSLSGLHANTQDIARNAWNITVSAHSYAIGGNSQAEHFRLPNAIAGFLTSDTCEACNTYNMLKLTGELWLTNPDTTTYFDFYERALLNHLLGQQDPSNSHGHVTYFTPLNPGGRRGVGPAWGGGPVILNGNYCNEILSTTPALDLATVKRSGATGLAFTATAGGKTVNLGQFYDAQGFNYNVYWSVNGKLPA
ncbi:uncharacterized protein GLRG_04809 [Colletotrichum graminicola M1.001]|uniref:Non-reducing end beta-L-arabinofuranosidase-like GH127 catalytic domain-containing protein n=1 Tax=Colletotrichum graminicola (strain M1.001 / M2 / FGSC 10212) TaxID=645133 RepID=E3QFM7_COLGM|nr:uncharacterized protein GLRG_04809 [Colletotrichum graminicola M1.001]EFQ29665.1 hypothetical protein GLRG_04809 [Colletotrichum graminicola M1.001]